jgi:hypothetical protein
MAGCVCIMFLGYEAGGCAGLMGTHFWLLLLIADVVVQTVIAATLWTFSMRAVADGELLFSARLENILLQHRCRIKDWQYLLVAGQVCNSCFRVDCEA